MALLRRDASTIRVRYPQTIPQNIWINEMAVSLQQDQWMFVRVRYRQTCGHRPPRYNL